MLNIILFSTKVLTQVQYIVIFCIAAAVVLALLIAIWLINLRAKKKRYLKKMAKTAPVEPPAAVTAAADTVETVAEPAIAANNSPEMEADQDKISALKAEIADLKNELMQQRSRQTPSTAQDLKMLEEELLRAQEQYASYGARIEAASSENDRLELYIKRIDLLEKIMQLGAGIERLKKAQESVKGNRPDFYYRLLDQVRRLNDRIDEMETKNAGYLPGDDYYAAKYRPGR